MSTIEEVLRSFAGQKIRISVSSTSSGRYQASLSPDGVRWRVEMGATPDEALKKVLGIIPGAAGQLYEPPAAVPSTSLDDLLV